MILEDLNRNDLEKIKKECSEFIKHNDQPLWRGMRDRGGLSQVKIRTDRKPLNTGVVDNILYNYIFEMKYKIKDIRRRTAYVSTSTKQAKNYGSLHAIFPINGTKMLFNPLVEDSAYMMKSLRNEFADSFDHEAGEHTPITSILDQMEEDANIEDMQSFINVLEHEMMFMNVGDIDIKKLLNGFYHNAEKIQEIKNYELFTTNQSLPNLHGREIEIGLFDSPYYYAISDSAMPPPQYYKEWLNSTLRN